MRMNETHVLRTLQSFEQQSSPTVHVAPSGRHSGTGVTPPSAGPVPASPVPPSPMPPSGVGVTAVAQMPLIQEKPQQSASRVHAPPLEMHPLQTNPPPPDLGAQTFEQHSSGTWQPWPSALQAVGLFGS